MNDKVSKSELVVLPPIPAKRYFTIGEVSELCGVKPHVLRYWEQEFTQLKPVKRRGNRRYYQHHEVLLIRRIRELLYEHGFTISGARNKLDGRLGGSAEAELAAEPKQDEINLVEVRHELEQILDLLMPKVEQAVE
ncbi:DNA-binding transcriptional regulator, MerR family [Collimonas sp. OK607]|uniref:MerR family transcriptional regulator n=1 Tax=Collimonas sp. OK607 TaxID=1798194 RepID=UPI0008EA1A20|nr:MerR family transcriptional regulator [Collimonas sp. OK607]SFB31571.1 DNA-binding transcriptional regulator, MerR family [Collimonas sp. OK607]